MKKIQAFAITNLLVIIVPSLAQVSWVVNNTAEFKNGDTMELICTVTGSCCSSARKWNGGPSFSLLMNDGAPSDPNKYGEIIHSSSFSLLIYNMDRSDFLYDYRCTYGFDDSTRSALSPPGNARYVPAASEIQELSSSTAEDVLNFEVNVTTVFPAPSCTAEFGGADLTSSMTTTSTDNFPFKFAEISMANVVYTCPGSLNVSCSVGSYSFNVLTLNPCEVTTEGSTEGTGSGGNGDGTMIIVIMVLIIFIIVVIIIIIIICCLLNKRCRSRYLRKDSKFIFTWPAKDIVVFDTHDKDFKIERPEGGKIEIQCLRTEEGLYMFDGQQIWKMNGVKVRNSPFILFNPYIEIDDLKKEHEGLFNYGLKNRNGCSLRLEICNDIIISSKPLVYWAHEGEWLKLQLVENSFVGRWIKKNSKNGQETRIPSPPKKNSLVLKNINNEDAGSYIAANTSETWKSGCLTLKVVNSLVTVGKKDGSHVTIIKNSIKLKFTECKLSSIKLLKWRKSLLTEGTKISELESTSNYELILSEITKGHEGRYWCEVTNKNDTSTKSGILTLQVVHAIVNVGMKSASCSATIGDSIQIRFTEENIPQQIIFKATSGTNQIAPEPKITKITDTASFLIEKISQGDEGCYQFASADGDAISGVLTLSVMEENDRYNSVYIGRSGARQTLESIPDKKKRKKKKKKNINEIEDEEEVELE